MALTTKFQTNERVSKRISDDSRDYSAAFHTRRGRVRLTCSWWCQYYSPAIDREVFSCYEMWRPLLTLDVEKTLLLAGLNQASSRANFIMQKKLFRRVTCASISRRCGSFNSDAVSRARPEKFERARAFGRRRRGD